MFLLLLSLIGEWRSLAAFLTDTQAHDLPASTLKCGFKRGGNIIEKYQLFWD